MSTTHRPRLVAHETRGIDGVISHVLHPDDTLSVNEIRSNIGLYVWSEARRGQGPVTAGKVGSIIAAMYPEDARVLQLADGDLLDLGEHGVYELALVPERPYGPRGGRYLMPTLRLQGEANGRCRWCGRSLGWNGHGYVDCGAVTTDGS